MVESTLSIDEARAVWNEYERQLYPLAVSDALRYQRIINIARALADDMYDISSSEELLSRWPPLAETMATVVSARGLSLGAMPHEQIAGIAFALRDREITQETTLNKQQSLIKDARESGKPWVVLHESGDLDAGLMDPYSCTELHLASGLTLVALTQADPENGTPVFVISVIKLDAYSGELIDSAPGIEDWREYDLQAEFLASRTAIREHISADAGATEGRT